MCIMSNSSNKQSSLFGESREVPGPGDAALTLAPAKDAGGLPQVHAPPPRADHQDLARHLDALFGPRWHFGTSSWHFPGWAGIVYAGHWPESHLSRHGLRALASHPLLRSVSLDRAFYRSLDRATYTALAEQVPDTFRFVVKAPASVTDALLRDSDRGRAVALNPGFLDPVAAIGQALEPACSGLGAKLGTLVFQLSPLPWALLRDGATPALERLETFWSRLMPAVPPGIDIAVEVRDPQLLGPPLARQLRAHGVRYCLGLHDRMPPIAGQLDMLRALWPGNLVCRWNLQRGLRYASARDLFAPFDRLQAQDLATRRELARVISATLRAGYSACVTINNKAEGSAPLSVLALATSVWDHVRPADALSAGGPESPATRR